MRAVVIAVVAVAAFVVALSLGADPEVALALPNVNGKAGALDATTLDVREPAIRELVPVSKAPPPLAAPLRGTPDGARDIRVVDENGAGVAGARIERDRQLIAVTDAQGEARLTELPQYGVDISAPGRRFEYTSTPPASEPWIVVLRRANRLEITLDTRGDPGGYHVEVRLSPSFVQQTFYQSKYVLTPGRAVADTPGWWSAEPEGRFSRWQLGFGPERLAVLDQLHDGGPIELELRRFDVLLDRRTLELPSDGVVTRIAFRVAPAPPAIVLRVLDHTDTPLCGASVRQAPRRGATIDASLEQGFPIWAPRAITDALGVCHLPRPTEPDAVFVLAKDGFAVRALTWAELVRAGFVVRLDAGFAVDVEVRGCFGEVLTEGWTTGFTDHVRPSAGLGHDSWLDATSGGDGPVFHFAGLPVGVVEFRFTHLPLNEVLRHDTRVPNVRFVAAESLDELMLGK